MSTPEKRAYDAARYADPVIREERKARTKAWRVSPQGKMMRQAAAKARRSRVRALLNALKSVPCADCGNTFPPYVMDFDHLRDKKSKKSAVGLMAMQEHSMKVILEEIAKCEVVCSNCHRIRTYGPKRRLHVIA